ncbi:MAG: enoyl-CoA hydratase/isomerase family protein [Actinomycetota bacterium]|nr:enoyl-CoA hydratase/isomerase family protein [Actinomycetota bacterium]
MTDDQDRPSPEEIVLYEKDPATKIATITLDRADDLNAMTIGAQHRYADLVRQANFDDDVKVLVIRANGPNLGSGADLPELMGIMADPDGAGMKRALRIPEDADVEYPPRRAYRYGANNLQNYTDPSAGMRSLQDFKKISILEVRGYCYGWHFYQAADADIIISSEDALFGHAAFRYAGYAARMWQWCETMGLRRFMEMVFTGRPFTAQEMYDCGFVNTVVPFDDLEAMTQRYALACSRSRPTDTVFVQKVFFEIFKQQKGEYMGSIISGLLESMGPQMRSDPSAMDLDEMMERGLTNSVRDNDERYPPEWRLSHRGRAAE